MSISNKEIIQNELEKGKKLDKMIIENKKKDKKLSIITVITFIALCIFLVIILYLDTKDELKKKELKEKIEKELITKTGEEKWSKRK